MWLILQGMRLGTAAPALLVALLLGGAGARADKEKSLEHYQEGKEHYAAGSFERAVESFLAAYREEPAKEYLFNIAQAYRRLGECEPALDYYRRYLAEGAAEQSRPVVERHVDALAAECGGERAEAADEEQPRPSAEEAPADSAAPSGPGETAGASGPRGRELEAAPETEAREPPAAAIAGAPRDRRRMELAAGAGVALFDIGDVEVPLVAGARLGAGISWKLGGVELTPGLSVGLFPMRYEQEAAGTAYLVSVLAGGAASVELGRRVSIRLEIGAGDLVFAGLGGGNPFTADGMASGALHMPSGRVAGGIDVQMGRDLALRAVPAVAYSRGHDDLAPDIDAIVRASLLLGVAYRP